MNDSTSSPADRQTLVPVTVVLLTLNEEANIVDCIQSCGFSDDIHVLDSGSTDRTVELAHALGATVHTHPFTAFGQQRNWAIDNIPHKYDWVLHLDADERSTPELVAEMGGIIASKPDEAGFYVPHKLIFLGRWLRHAEGYPVYQMRFFHRGRMRFRDYGHGQREDTEGAIGWLKQPYLHHNFSKGVSDWLDKHNRYSTLEATAIDQGQESGPVSVNHFPFGNAVARRRFLRIYTRRGLPAQWLLRFAWMYILRLGFMDGYAGLRYCQLVAFYELLIATKLRELRMQRTATAVRCSCASTVPAAGPVSVLILTKDEEANIGQCLECLSFSDDIVVLDSCSSDNTVQIARGFPNVRIVQRPFDTEWKQRNFGLREIDYRNRWVYICDADERVATDLAREVQEIAARPETAASPVAYRTRFRNYFMGKWIRRASGYPVWVIRFVIPQRVRYEIRETNVHPICEGAVGELQGHFDHYSFSLGLQRWLEKHNYYSTREAAEGVKIRNNGIPGVGNLAASDPMVRRRAMKNLSYFLIGRSFWRFLTMYFLRRGILDGVAGFRYSVMIAMYEYWIELKIREAEGSWGEHSGTIAMQLLRESPR